MTFCSDQIIAAPAQSGAAFGNRLWEAYPFLSLPDEAKSKRSAPQACAVVIVRTDRYILGGTNTPEALDRISGDLPTCLHEETTP